MKDTLVTNVPCRPAVAAKEKKKLTVCGLEFVYVFFFAIITSHIGWIAETICKLIGRGYAGTHAIPFIGVYGLIAFAFQILLGNPNDIAIFGKKLFKTQTRKTKALSNVISYVAICLTVMIGELAAGHLVESISGAKLWNYLDQPLHITQYTCALSIFGFGTGAFLLFKLYPVAVNFVRNCMKYKTALIIDSTLGALVVADMLVLWVQILVLGYYPSYILISII